MPPSLNFYPILGFNPYQGAGRLALGIVKGLEANGISVRVYPDLHAPSLVFGYAQAFDAPHIVHTRRTAYTLMESSQPPTVLVEALNRHVERVFVPCPPAVESYQTHGVIVPVHYVPVGIDLFSVPEPVAEHGPREKYTFLTYSYGEFRKGADAVVKAFIKTFGNDDRYRLLVKAREGRIGWLALIDHPHVEVIPGYQSEDEWFNLLRQADCFVFPSRAEGWGLPPREAALLGIPAIATQWLGMWDVDQWGIPLPVTETRQCDFRMNPYNADEALWVEPDVDLVAERMQWVVDHPVEARQIAMAGREYLIANFTWAQIGEQIADLMGIF
jgi:glycosyltransferase involved in cell wall biosynthesis